MRPRRDPVPRARDSWVWLGGLLLLGILGAGVVAAAMVLWENVDVRQLTPALVRSAPPAPLPATPVPAAHPDGSFAVVLLNSSRNADFFPDSTWYRRSLAAWRSLAEGLGGEVREVTDARGLQTVTPEELLLLPEAPCLTPGERTSVRNHLERGGGVVANWALGARDGSCAWRGWQTVADLTGALDVREIQAREALYLVVPGGHALSPGLDPGTRVELRGDPTLALRTDGPRVYWSDWALNPSPDATGGGADAAAQVVRTPDGGRVAWFGARLEQAATPEDEVKLRRLVRNGILWAAGRPLAAPAAWPAGSRAALVVALDVESEPRNALPVATLLREEELPGTFFAVTQLVQADEGLARSLVAAGEVGSQTADHTPLAGRTAQDQSVRLRRSWDEVRGWTGAPPSGLRPPEERFDAHTLEGWARAGGSYLLALNEARSAAPELHLTGEGPVVVLPRLLKDDYNVFVQDRALRARRLLEAWWDGATKLHSLGGLAVVAGHTQILDSPVRRNTLRELADSVRSREGWWVARGQEVAEWWRARSDLRLSFVAPAPGDEPSGVGVTPSGLPHLLVELPEGGEPVEGLWVELVLPGADPAWVPWVDDAPAASEDTPWGIRVQVGRVEPGGRVRVALVRMEDQEGAE